MPPGQASREQFLHQAALDDLHLVDGRLGLLDSVVHRGENGGNLALHSEGRKGYLDETDITLSQPESSNAVRIQPKLLLGLVCAECVEEITAVENGSKGPEDGEVVATDQTCYVLANERRDANVVMFLRVLRNDYVVGFKSARLNFSFGGSRLHEIHVGADKVVVVHVGIVAKANFFLSGFRLLVDAA